MDRAVSWRRAGVRVAPNMRWIMPVVVALTGALLLAAAGVARGTARPGVQALAGLDSAEIPAIEAQMRAVERWRGTPFTRPVAVQRAEAPADGRQGWYDAESGVLTLAVGPAHALYLATVTHELVHALQDQHVDLGLLAARRDADAAAALHAVAEAEALAGTEAILGFSMAAHLQPAADAPIDASHAQLLFEAGPARRWLDENGGPGRALTAPPPTTAALFGGAAAPPASPGCGPAAGATAGALSLWRIATTAPVSRPHADGLAAAWQGDRWEGGAAGGAWGIRFGAAPTPEVVDAFIAGLSAALAPHGCGNGGAACPEVSGALQPAAGGVDLCLRWSTAARPG